MITVDNLKSTLVAHLKTCYIKGDIDRLWGETKAWFKARLIEWSGGYASFGEKITVRTTIEKEVVEFKINLKFILVLLILFMYNFER